MINGAQLKSICQTLNIDNANKIAALLDNICPKYGINTPDIFHEFIANLAEECGEFNRFAENLNYSVEALKAKFSNRITCDQADTVGRKTGQPADQDAIADIIYGGEWGRKNLGNTQQGDGWIFRGSGPIQMTGRGNVTRFNNYYNNLVGTSFTSEQMAEMLRRNIEIGIHSACWIFTISFKLIDEAVNDDMRKIVKAINGGFTNYPSRLKYYELAKKYVVT